MKKVLAMAMCMAVGGVVSAGTAMAAAPAAQAPAAAQAFTHVEYYSAAKLRELVNQTLAEMQAKGTGSGGPELSDDANSQLKISVRTTSGGAEVHRHWSDVIIVMGGEVTLTTGGTVPDLKETGTVGEPRGTKIVGGQSFHLRAGDVVHIPINTPHMMMAIAGKNFSALVVKVKE